METKDIKINVTDASKELVIRHGEALPMQEPVSIRPEFLNIKAPAEWIENHAPDKTNHPYVVLNRENRSITYRESPSDHYGTVILGCIELDKTLSKLQINEQKRFDCDALAQHLKRYKMYAESPAVFMDVITKLKGAKVKLTAHIEKWKEKDGSAKVDFVQVIDSDLLREFKVTVPIFKGEDAVTINVEIVIESADSGKVVLFLESLEVEELITTKVNEIIDRERARFEKFSDCVILEK